MLRFRMDAKETQARYGNKSNADVLFTLLNSLAVRTIKTNNINISINPNKGFCKPKNNIDQSVFKPSCTK